MPEKQDRNQERPMDFADLEEWIFAEMEYRVSER